VVVNVVAADMDADEMTNDTVMLVVGAVIAPQAARP